MRWLIFRSKVVNISFYHIHIFQIQGSWGLPSRAPPHSPRKFERKNKQLINYFNKPKRSCSRNQKITTSTNPKEAVPGINCQCHNHILAQSVWGKMAFRNIKSLFIKKYLSKRFYERLGVIFWKFLLKQFFIKSVFE